METLQNFIFLIIGALLTWIGTRWSKSTDTRTQLLTKIDDFVNELTNVYQNGLLVLINPDFKFIEWSKEYYKKANYPRWIGVAEALGNVDLTLALQDNLSKYEEFYKLIEAIADIKAKKDFNLDDEKLLDEKYVELEKVAGNLSTQGEEVHRLIAKEMIRIFPSISNYIKRFIAWIKPHHKTDG
jgi:hypothetical protein